MTPYIDKLISSIIYIIFTPPPPLKSLPTDFLFKPNTTMNLRGF